jgi:hypothetical protein
MLDPITGLNLYQYEENDEKDYDDYQCEDC